MGILSIDVGDKEELDLLIDLARQKKNLSRKQSTYTKYSSLKEQLKGVVENSVVCSNGGGSRWILGMWR